MLIDFSRFCDLGRIYDIQKRHYGKRILHPHRGNRCSCSRDNACNNKRRNGADNRRRQNRRYVMQIQHLLTFNLTQIYIKIF